MANNIIFKNMTVESVITDLRNRIDKSEHMLGRSQPFCDTNSEFRKLIHSTHLEQRLPLIQTGYENEIRGKYE